MSSPPPPDERIAARPRRARLVRVTTLVLLGILVAIGIAWAADGRRERAETERTTARFDPPVWAGQDVPFACSGGFYARDGMTVVLTIVAHCVQPGATLRDLGGRFLGVFGPRAELADCPPLRFCAPSDFLALALASDVIPWGHLNMVDLGAGGYRTFGPTTRPLACHDVAVGARAETNGREHYRIGAVLEIAPYAFETDTIFPCMVRVDIPVFVGDSGGAVLVDGQPAGVISRQLNGQLGFTPLAEGLENLGLVLCTTPDCELSPTQAVQPQDGAGGPG